MVLTELFSEIHSKEEAFLASEKKIIGLYLKYGSIEEVYTRHSDLGYSAASIQRLLDKWGIVKSPEGRSRQSIAKMVEAFKLLAKHPYATVDQIISYTNSSDRAKLSPSTFFRAQREIRKGNISATASGLIVYKPQNPYDVLIGNEQIRTKNSDGLSEHLLTSPAVYSSFDESQSMSITRTLQQEVLSASQLKGI